MHYLAHHAGEQALAPLLLLAGGGLGLLAAIGRERLAAVLTKWTPTISTWARRCRGTSSRPRTAGKPTTRCRGARP